MKRKRIPNLPATLTRQPDGLFRDCKTGIKYTYATLVRLYGTEAKNTNKQEVKPINHENWMAKYDNY